MLLYSRKRVRYRRDGYCWKKRKDGKTTREDHMKLKVQGTECIYGCYVHSAILPTFHRRCYWLLQNPDIVLVHYLNVPYSDDNKMVIAPTLSYCADKKEWTKDELVSQLKPMFYSENEPDLNNELEVSTAETVEAIVQQLMEKQRAKGSAGSGGNAGGGDALCRGHVVDARAAAAATFVLVRGDGRRRPPLAAGVCKEPVAEAPSSTGGAASSAAASSTTPCSVSSSSSSSSEAAAAITTTRTEVKVEEPCRVLGEEMEFGGDPELCSSSLMGEDSKEPAASATEGRGLFDDSLDLSHDGIQKTLTANLAASSHNRRPSSDSSSGGGVLVKSENGPTDADTVDLNPMDFIDNDISTPDEEVRGICARSPRRAAVHCGIAS
ncbi:hypothetical protein MRX96_043552 [Rhipicephalus microplus]